MPIRNLDEIFVPETRTKREYPADKLEELVASILSDKGLLHPPVVEADGALLVGEHRLLAIQAIAARGLDHRCNGKTLRPGLIYCTDIHELSDLARAEAVYEENAIRVDFTWQEKAKITDALHRLREMQKQQRTPGLPGIDAPQQSLAETAAEIKAKAVEDVTRGDERDIKADLTVAAWLTAGEDAEVSNAPTRKEALRIIERKLEDQYRLELARRFVANRQEGKHLLKQGDMLKFLPETPNDFYDCIVCDPPWGVGADQWENGNATRLHSYVDDMHTAEKIYMALAMEGYRICKPRAHTYIMCSFGGFQKLAAMFRTAGWDVWPRPLVWYKGNSGSLPRPEHGPRLTYECILYGIKGDKRALLSAPHDVIQIAAPQIARRAAEKPAGLYHELLRRSCVAGDDVLDPCCGVGAIFPAANSLKLRATGYDSAEDAIGIASQRLAEVFSPRDAVAKPKLIEPAREAG